MSNNQRIRKKSGYTPIVLTSKAIRPIDRVQYEQFKQQTRYSHIKERRSLQQKMYKTNRDLKNYANQYISNTKLDIRLSQNEQQDFKNLISKQTAASVVKVQFQFSKRQNFNKSALQFQAKDIDPLNTSPNKSFYYSNIKSFQQFATDSKTKPQNKFKRTPKPEEDNQQDFNEYLSKYYLNIKKVKPFLKKNETIKLLSPNKIQQIHRAQHYAHQLSDLCDQKQVLNLSKFGLSPRHQKDLEKIPSNSSTDKSDSKLSQQNQNSDVIKKIENDIALRKNCVQKKDYFVFGMGQNATKNVQINPKNRYENYKDFLYKINFTNGLYVKSRNEQNQKPFKYFVGFGNNSAVVKAIIRRRYWWQITDKIQEANFAWTQLKVADYFDTQIKNKSHKVTSQKRVYLKIQNEQDQLKKLSENQDSVDFHRQIMNTFDYSNWKSYAEKNKKLEEKGGEAAYSKRVSGILRKKKIIFIQNSNKIKVHNHFQCNYFLGNKKALFYSLRKYYKLQKKDPFDYIPTTFHISQGLQDRQFDNFLDQYMKVSQQRKTDKQLRNIWIVKPGQLTNRGKGITVCATLDEIKYRLKSKEKNNNGSQRTFIVQKYIEKPLLYLKRKFDIRHYMLMTCINGKMKGFWYSDGYIRTTSFEYNIKNCKDVYTHLTNDAVQQNSQDYGKYERGNKLSYLDFQKYLTRHVNKKVDFFNQILPKMKNLAADSMKATYSILEPKKRQHNFELFGLDFMLDQDLNVYLIEVNTNPCLETSCPLLTKIIMSLLENILKLCVDPILPPPFEWPNQRKFNLGENPLEENKFSLIFDEQEEGEKLNKLYQNISKIDQNMGEIDEEDEQYKDQEQQLDEQNVEDVKK